MMLSTAIFRAVFEDRDAHGLHALAGAYLCASGATAIAQALEDLLEHADDGKRGYRDDLEMAFGRNIIGGTVETVCDDWADVLSLGVRNTSLNTDLGVLVLHVLVRADYLMASKPAADAVAMAGLKANVADQLDMMVQGPVH